MTPSVEKLCFGLFSIDVTYTWTWVAVQLCLVAGGLVALRFWQWLSWVLNRHHKLGISTLSLGCFLILIAFIIQLGKKACFAY